MKVACPLFINFMMVIFVNVDSHIPVFLVSPVSVAAVDGTTVEFSCTAENVEEVLYRVNGSSASNEEFHTKGFFQQPHEVIFGTIIRRNLTVAVSSQYNNTEIFCRGFGELNNVNSKKANLNIQGPLSPVGDLFSLFNDYSNNVNISWSPPFTLPGTAITGYNISVTSNVTATNYFTSDSYYMLPLTDITDYTCDEINITVSGYNGLDGEDNRTLVPSSNATVPIYVGVMIGLTLQVTVDMSNICDEDRPTTVNTALLVNNTEMQKMDFMLLGDPTTEMYSFDPTFHIVEDTFYKIKVSFSIFDGLFHIITTQKFHTFGVQSVHLNDTDEDSVSCKCFFYSFSSDKGCEVLLLSDTQKYEKTFTRSGEIATGSIFDIETGLYHVDVFDQDNSEVVITTTIKVIQESSIPISYITSISISATVTTLAMLSTTKFVYMTPTSLMPDVANEIQLTLYTAIVVPPLVTIILLVVVSMACVIWKNKHSSHKEGKRRRSDAFFLTSSDYNGTPETDNDNHSQDDDDRYVQSNTISVGNTTYAELDKIDVRPIPSQPVDCKVIYSDHVMKGQPPPPPYEPVELKQVSNLQASATVIPAGVKVDDSEFDNEIVEMRLPHMENYQEAVDQKTKMPQQIGSNYPPAPEERALSPPTEDEDQPPPIPGRHLPDLIQNNHSLSNGEEGFTDESMHPALGELTSEKEELQHGGHFMNTPTATYL